MGYQRGQFTPGNDDGSGNWWNTREIVPPINPLPTLPPMGVIPQNPLIPPPPQFTPGNDDGYDNSPYPHYPENPFEQRTNPGSGGTGGGGTGAGALFSKAAPFVAGAGAVASIIGNITQRAKQKRLMNAFERDSSERIAQNYAGNQRDTTMGAMISAASIMGQDPNVQWRDMENVTTFRPGIGATAMRATQDAAFRNIGASNSNMPLALRNQALAQQRAAAVEAGYQSALQSTEMEEQRRIQDLLNRQQIGIQNTTGRTLARNNTTRNSNQLISQFGSMGAAFFGKESNIANLMANREQGALNSYTQQVLNRQNENFASNLSNLFLGASSI